MSASRRPPGAAANDDEVRALLDRYGCAVPLHAVRARFLGDITSPVMAASPLETVKALWSGELPEFESLDAINELLRVLIMGLWNRLARHQERNKPFRLMRVAVPRDERRLGTDSPNSSRGTGRVCGGAIWGGRKPRRSAGAGVSPSRDRGRGRGWTSGPGHHLHSARQRGGWEPVSAIHHPNPKWCTSARTARKVYPVFGLLSTSSNIRISQLRSEFERLFRSGFRSAHDVVE